MEGTLASDEVIYQGEDLPPNIMRTMSIEKGDIEAGFAEADLVVEREYRVGWQEQMYIEPQGMIAVPDDDGAVTLIGSLQCPFYITKALKELLGCDDSGVRVVQAVTGGGFGARRSIRPCSPATVPSLAKKAGQPVKIIYDRVKTSPRPPSGTQPSFATRTGVKKDGTLTAMAVEFDIDGGAYVTLSRSCSRGASSTPPAPIGCPTSMCSPASSRRIHPPTAHFAASATLKSPSPRSGRWMPSQKRWAWIP